MTNLHALTSSFGRLETPFYYYDLSLLDSTLNVLCNAAQKRNYHVHYALKANACEKILQHIQKSGLGADCVSGNEIKASLEANFSADKIVFAGVGKADKEIIYGLLQNIFCFNCESTAELKVLNEIASSLDKKAKVAIRINPNVNAYTHHYITTGLEENKFGINPWELPDVLELLKSLKNIELNGLHFHIGSQILDLEVFKNLCVRVNELQQWFFERGINVKHVNLGGGLGVNYQNPDELPIVDFENFFGIFEKFLERKPNQEVHFELGRAIVAQCGSLISKVLYLKRATKKEFVILDAGMTDLIRPALYQAFHKIENISKSSQKELYPYDVVGPICESSDCFGKAIDLPETQRGDIIAIRTAGAYGQVMASNYNLRELPKAIYSDELQIN